MQKIMFSDRYDLTWAVRIEKKTQTRRIEPEDNPRYKIGEIVAVARSYEDIRGCVITNLKPYENTPGWTNKMFVRAELMPERIKMLGIRWERLQDISEEDCIAEGVECIIKGGLYAVMDKKTGLYQYGKTARDVYAWLIDKVSGKGTWDKNPWVRVYDFKLVK